MNKKLTFFLIAAIALLTASVNVQAQTFTVTFDSQGGSPVAPITGIAYNSRITEPTPPFRPNYVFVGWNREHVGDYLWNFTTDRVQGDIELFALWGPDNSLPSSSHIQRPIIMPQIEGIGTYPAAGMHYVPSRTDFMFEMWPLAGYSLSNVTITTDQGNEVIINN